MNFEFPEDVQALRDGVREIVQGKVAPRAAEIDEKAEYPEDIHKLFAENGILAIPFPEETNDPVPPRECNTDPRILRSGPRRFGSLFQRRSPRPTVMVGT